MPYHRNTATRERHDLYRSIHKALRQQMFECLLQFGRVNPVCNDELLPAVDRIRHLLELLHGHGRHENDHIHTAIEAQEPGASREIDDQHRAQDESMNLLELQCRQLLDAKPEFREAHAHSVYLQLALLIAENLQHMHQEERRLNTLLWHYYSDMELREIEQRIVNDLTPELSILSLRWMAASSNPQELEIILGGLREAMPEPAFIDLLGALREDIGAARQARLLAGFMPTSAPQEREHRTPDNPGGKS